MATPRNLPRPGVLRGVLTSRGSETYTPAGRACGLLLHPVRRWAVQHAVRHGSVSVPEIVREFTYLEHNGAATNILRPAVVAGVLALQERRRGTSAPHVYTPGDLSDLRALRELLTEILAPVEVQP